MPEVNYSQPTARLLSLGEPPLEGNWLDYAAEFGLTLADVPELIRLATDEALRQGDFEAVESWGPVHAWRALAQLHAAQAVMPLLGILEWIDEFDDNAIDDEMPGVLSMLWPESLPPLVEYLTDTNQKMWARLAAAEGLVNIGRAHPGSRDQCVAALSGALECFEENDEGFNAFLIHYLARLKAVEAAPLVERAFAAKEVDLSVMGDWEDYQVEAGMLAERITPPFDEFGLGSSTVLGGRSPKIAKEDKKTKNKHKQEKKSRKKNRKKK